MLTWHGPGVVTDGDGSVDDRDAGCTWRTQEDYDGAALSNEHRSLALRYVVTRKVEGETEYETVATQFHLYGSEGLGTYAVQAWVDTDVPNGKVFYRIQAALGQDRSAGAVVSRQVGPVAEPEMTADPESPPD